ncbi:BBE domain-containing protein [Mesorhizobium onobrychidis]|uniref:BBE domain-containing protein n=1 Tax=Mesorhizobium onobrychidis TaxID=2775404 RepID=A0ABY5R3L0_9HYPH|nr:BBE domain-containing protein [Mesorhizobium onobrychidis]UVC17779.1 BBE domain-containing protein [Mesorhizobium onobrychidis]
MGRVPVSKCCFASSSRKYLNFPGLGEDNASLVSSAFGDNHARLRELKRRYDTANLFRMNQTSSRPNCRADLNDRIGQIASCDARN